MPDDQHTPRPGAGRPSDVVTTVLAHAAELRSHSDDPLRVLDLGGGTGGVAVALAREGHDVTVVDPSPNALAALGERAREAAISDRITAVQGDGDTLEIVLGDRSMAGFDLVCCHGTLEFVDDPATTLRATAAALRPGGALSLVVAGRLAVALAKATAGEFAQARAALVDPAGRWGDKDPLPRRYDLEGLEQLLADTGFTIDQVRGHNIIGHLVAARLAPTDTDRAALAELDELLVAGPGRDYLRTLASSLHVLARRG